MMTNSRPAPAGHLLGTALALGAALMLSACGSTGDGAATGTGGGVPTSVDVVSTTMLEVATTTVTPGDARSGFMSDVAAAAPILVGLTEADLGCMADRLLVELDPAEVVTLTRNGPRPDQAGLAVAALRDCDLVLHVVGLGIGQSIAADPDAPPLDPGCLLEGITADDLVPYLEARFETGSVDLEDDEAMDLLLDTPMMANTIRCSTEAMLGVSADAPAVCTGLADRLGDLMASLMQMEPESDGAPDPFALIGVFRVTDEVFAWLVDEVPTELRDDAMLVRDTTARIGTLMAEAFATLAEHDDGSATGDPSAGDGQGDDEARMAAFLGVMARIGAEFEADMDEVDAASARLRDWTIATCGESSSMLFELLTGMGA